VRPELTVQPLSKSSCRHLTHDSEPRRELQAGSDERSENGISSQSERREISAELNGITAPGRPSDRFRSPLSCWSRTSSLALRAPVVLSSLAAPGLHLVSGLAVVGETRERQRHRLRQGTLWSRVPCGDDADV